MKLLHSLAAAAIGLVFAGAALAAPVPYINAPMDTPQAMVNSAIANVNSANPINANWGAVTGSAGAATLNAVRGQITTEALVTAASAVFTETLTNSTINANSQVFYSVANGTSTTGQAAVGTATPAAGSVVLKIPNVSTGAALNGTLVINYLVVN